MEVVWQKLAVRVELLEERLSGFTELHLARRSVLFPGSGGEEQEEQEEQEEAGEPQAKKQETAAAGAAGAAADGTQGAAEEGKGDKAAAKAADKAARWGDKIALNCRQCTVLRVAVNGREARFVERDFLKKIVNHDNVRDLTTFYAFLAGDLMASRDGELEVLLAPELRDARELVVRIDYELVRPTGGVRFAACGALVPDKEQCVRDGYTFTRGTNRKRYYPHMFTTTSLCGAETLGACSGARCWFPCVDTLQARCRFVVEATIPEALTAVSVGVLASEGPSEASGWKRVVFEHRDPIAPHNVALCVGPFVEATSRKMDNVAVSVFHLPGAPPLSVKRSLVHVCRALKEMLEYMEMEHFPAKQYKQVFVDHNFAYTDVAPFAMMSLVSSSLLLPVNEPMPHTVAGAGLMYDRHLHFVQAQGVAYSFFGCLVPAKAEGDVWIIAGLAGYLAYRYALKAWKQVKIQLPIPDSEGSGDGPVGRALPSKTPPPGAKQDYFVGSTDPRELLSAAFDRLKAAKYRFDTVRKQHGTAGNALQRPLQRPNEVRFPVDSYLWAARGMELDCLFAQRAFFMMHMLEGMVNSAPGHDDDFAKDDTFANILLQYVMRAMEADEYRAKRVAAFYGEVEEAPDAARAEPTLQRTNSMGPGASSTAGAETAAAEEKRKQDEASAADKGAAVGIGEFDLIRKLCNEGGLKSSDFNVFKSGNFASNWLRKCSFLELRGSAEYNHTLNTLDLHLEQVPHKRGTRPMTFLMRVRVVEQDDTWHHERALNKERNEYAIPVHTQKQRQRGGRKAADVKARNNKWENPGTLKTSELLTLFNNTGGKKEERVWINENPVKYAILDPELMWLRHIEWRQSEVMYLELLSDPYLLDDVLQQCQALEQMATPRSETDHLTSKGQRAATETSSGPIPGAAAARSAENKAFDLRCACAIAGCIVDYRRPPRVRAEALLRLAEWQAHHAPDRAHFDKDGGASIEDRVGSHPWVGLNLILFALKMTLFHPKTGKLLPNDFGVPGELALKRAIPRALRKIRAKSGKPPDEVLECLLTLLRDNDNSVNNWSDAWYLRDLTSAAGEIVSNYVLGTSEEEAARAKSDVEHIGRRRTVKDILGDRFYKIIDHIRRYLQYDAIAPSPDHIITVGCLEALSELEATGTLAATTPFYAYAVFNTPTPPGKPEAAVVARHDWGALVREEAFKGILRTYVRNRGGEHLFKFPDPDDRDAAWLGTVKWVLEAVAADPCPRLQWDVVKYMLKLHADTIEERHPELRNNESPSGLFWPLSNARQDIAQKSKVPTTQIAGVLWAMFNESNECDGRLRVALSQLWRAIWQLDTPPIVKDTMAAHADLGPFQGWADLGHGDDDDDVTLAPVASPGKRRRSMTVGSGPLQGTPPASQTIKRLVIKYG